MSILKVVGIGAIAAVGGVMGAAVGGVLSIAPEVHKPLRKHLGSNGVEAAVVGTAILGAVLTSAPFIAACFTKED